MEGTKMASKVVLIDDVDGSEAAETVQFSIRDTSYEIDLSEANAAKLQDALAVYISHGRKVGGSTRRSGGKGSTRPDGSQTSAMRKWLQDHGHEVGAKGRIPADLQQIYHDAAQ
jgi:hypothetical protein